MTSISLVLVGLTALLHQCYSGVIHAEVFNGYKARPGQFPYQARLINYEANGKSSICGGSLIALNYVLSAAHCTQGVVKTTVFLGVTNIQDTNGVVKYDVPSSNIYGHPGFNSKTYANDISILKLPKKVTLTSNIQTIALPKLAWANPSTFDNYELTVSGWGRMHNFQNSSTQDLQYAVVYKMNQNACYYWFIFNNPVTDGMICTSKTPTYAGTCSGDSGGPLMVQLQGTRYLIGATSWSVGDCESFNPIAFANIAYYLKWINQVTGILIS